MLQKSFKLPGSYYSLFVSFIIIYVLIFSFKEKLDFIDNKFYDFKLRFCSKFRTDPDKIKNNIVIIYLDDKKTKSLIGNISSDLHARFINKLKNYETRSIFYNYFFDTSSSDSLINAVKDTGNIFLPVLFDLHTDKKNAYWIDKYPLYFQKIIENNTLLVKNISGEFWYAGRGILQNDKIANAAKGIGHICTASINSDEKDTIQKATLLIDIDGNLIPSIELVLACDYLKLPIDLIVVESGKSIVLLNSKISNVKNTDIEIPINNKSEMLINYNRTGTIKDQGYIHTFSFITVLNPENKPEIETELKKRLKDKICLIGTSLFDSSIKNKATNVDINSQILYTILSKNFIRKVSFLHTYIIFTILMSIFLYFIKDLKGGIIFLICFSCIIVYLFISYVFFIFFNIDFSDIIPLIGFIIFGNINFFLDYIIRGREVEKLLYHSSMDSLTNVYNRRGFFSAIYYLAQIAKDNNYNIGIMVIDIDGFKQINDTYGHQKGDEIIVKVVNIIKTKIRRTDIIGRYGGDEFLLFLYGVDVKDLQNISEKIRQSVESETKNDLRVTVSIGVSNSNITSSSVEKDIDILIKKADDSLYAAKSAGKNKIFIYNS